MRVSTDGDRQPDYLGSESGGGAGIAPALHQDVEHMAMLVNCAKDNAAAPDADEALIHMPFIAWTWPPPLRLVGE